MRISVTVSSSSFSRNDFLFLPLRKDILRRICPIQLSWNFQDLHFVVSSEYKFCVFRRESFHQCILSKLCIETYVGFSVSDLTGHHFVCFKLLKNLCYLSSFKICKNYSFWSVLVWVIFSQVSPGISLQVTNLISRCQVTIQL